MDECASHVALFSTQALSLELAGERRFATLAALAIKRGTKHLWMKREFRFGKMKGHALESVGQF